MGLATKRAYQLDAVASLEADDVILIERAGAPLQRVSASAMVDYVTANIGAIKGAKGDPGGDASQVGTLAELSALFILVLVDRIRTTGFAEDGDGGGAFLDRAAGPGTGTWQSGDGAYWKLSKEQEISPAMFGALPNGVTQTANFQLWADYIAEYGCQGVVRRGNYTTGLIDFWRGTRVKFEPGCTVTVPAGQQSFFRVGRWTPNATSVLYNKSPDDIKIDGNGCFVFGNAAQTSHVIKSEGAVRPEICGFIIDCNGNAGKDGIYLGAGAQYPNVATITATVDAHIHHNTIKGAGRNNISVVSADGYTIEHNDISLTTGAVVGAGIDVEKNTHNDMSKRGHIRLNRIHNNAKNGVIVAFGDGVDIYGNTLYGNGAEAICVAAGGASMNTGVARSGVDWRAISAVDTATGWLTISNADTLDIGAVVAPATHNGGVLPATLTGGGSSYWVVVDKDSANTKVRLANLSTVWNTVTSLSDAGTYGTGALTGDPTTSSFYLRCWGEGHASNVKIYRNKFEGNNAGTAEVLISLGAYACEVFDNDFDCSTADRTAVYVRYCQRTQVYGNRGRGYKAGVNAVGLTAVSASQVRYGDNTWRDFQGYGEYFTSVFEVTKRGRDVMYNCGKTNNVGMYFEGAPRAEVCGKVRNDPGYVTTSAIKGDANTTYAVVDGCDVRGSGNSNGNSLQFSSSTTIFRANVIFDGSAVQGRWGSTTYDAPSLANGASVRFTCTCTGAQAGDAVDVTLGLALNGLTAVADVFSTGTAEGVITNNTGATVDLVSTTVRVAARRVFS